MKIERSQVIAFLSASAGSLLLIALIYFGSGRLSRFDPPLAMYAIATIFAAFAIVYRYAMWLQRPPTWRYFKASWRLFLRPKRVLQNIVNLVALFWQDIVIQRFIEKRSVRRWLAHMGIAWGCILAFMITLPLSWGWIQFLPAANATDYAMEFMGVRVLTFDPHGLLGFIFFNWLNISAVLLLMGIALAMHRRFFDRGAQAVQSIASDLIPLFLLFSVATTGLMLTASEHFMRGSNFAFISMLHAFTVVSLLLYLPFGKLFHVIQRPAQIGVAYYKEEGRRGAQAICPRSGVAFDSELHRDDLHETMRQLGYEFGDHQNLAPHEKIRIYALSQLSLLDDDGFVGSTERL
jgi:nitrate reductase gamma subunit